MFVGKKILGKKRNGEGGKWLTWVKFGFDVFVEKKLGEKRSGEGEEQLRWVNMGEERSGVGGE